MVSMLRITFLLLINFVSLSIIGQDSTYYRTLNLFQFIDSALSNHPVIKNSKLQLSIEKNKDISNIKPAEFYYQQGQMFSSDIDKGFEVRQNFGSPVIWATNKRIREDAINLRNEELKFAKAQIIAKVKSAYYLCVYQMNLLLLLNRQKALFDTLMNNISDTIKFTDIKLQLTIKLLEAQYAEIQNQGNEISSNFLNSKNELLRECYITSDVEPVNEELRIIEISASYDTTNRVPGKLAASLYQKKVDLANSRLKAENARFFPEITAGYFNRSINKISGYSGWQIGITVPLWFFSQTSARNEAFFNKQIAANEFEQQKFNDKRNTEGLLIEMDKLFEKLNYFYDSGLNYANILEQTAIKLLKEKHEAYTEILLALNTSYKIKAQNIWKP